MKLRPYQDDAINALYNYWIEGKGKNPIVSACVGAGKSLLIAKIVQDATENYEGTRILMLTHLAELIEQNAVELKKVYPKADIGIYSAGLNKKDKKHNILYAGIQSIAAKIHTFDPFDLVLIDECHLVPKNTSTRYGKTLETLRLMNPKVKVIGFSGTPYRLDGGYLHEGKNALFDGVAYDIGIKDLVEQGFLVKPIGKGAVNKIDLSNIHLKNGDFDESELSVAVSSDDVIESSVNEIVKIGENRKAWMVFCVSIKHAEKVKDALISRGITTDLITGSIDQQQRNNITSAFKNGELRCLISIATLTAGFNAPITDMVVILRATMSTSLFVQMCGRGLRLSPNKNDCIILDFGGNVERHGTLDNIIVPKKKGGSGDGKAPAKECPSCHSMLHAASSFCPDCGHEFPPPEINHRDRAYNGEILSQTIEPLIVPVDNVRYSRHTKAGSPDSVKITYQCGFSLFHEWVCLEHEGYAKQKADSFIASLGGHSTNVNEALFECDGWDTPKTLTIMKDGKYTKILKKDY